MNRTNSAHVIVRVHPKKKIVGISHLCDLLLRHIKYILRSLKCFLCPYGESQWSPKRNETKQNESYKEQHDCEIMTATLYRHFGN